MGDRTVSQTSGTLTRSRMSDLVGRLAILLRDAQPPFMQRSEIRDMQPWNLRQGPPGNAP